MLVVSHVCQHLGHMYFFEGPWNIVQCNTVKYTGGYCWPRYKYQERILIAFMNSMQVLKERGDNMRIKQENEMKMMEEERKEEEKRVVHRQAEMEKTEKEKLEKKEFERRWVEKL